MCDNSFVLVWKMRTRIVTQEKVLSLCMLSSTVCVVIELPQICIAFEFHCICVFIWHTYDGSYISAAAADAVLLKHIQYTHALQCIDSIACTVFPKNIMPIRQPVSTFIYLPYISETATRSFPILHVTNVRKRSQTIDVKLETFSDTFMCQIESETDKSFTFSELPWICVWKNCNRFLQKMMRVFFSIFEKNEFSYIISQFYELFSCFNL